MWKRNNTEIVKPRKIDSIEASWILRLLFFFFSSRRRHTRWNCDWSSECALPILAPIHRTPESLLARQRCAASSGQQPEAIAQAVGDLLGRQRADQWRGQFDGERYSIQPRSEERRVGKECRSRWLTYH